MYSGTSEYTVIFKCLNYNNGSSDLKDLGSDYYVNCLFHKMPHKDDL